jgi:hypothetical protein
MKSKQLPLSPVDWDLERQSHQLLCGELRRIAAEVAQRLIGCRAKFSAGLSA